MKMDDLHVKQDQWAHPATHAAARTKVKRARQKAKRALSKKLVTSALAKTEELQ